MEKLKSILSSATGKRIGPPVPPRPSPAAVAHALSKTRNVSPVNHPVEQTAPQQVPKAHGRTVIYKSPGYIQNLTNTNNGYNDQQQVNVNEENKHFDFKNDSSTSAPTEYQSVVVSESLEFVAGPNQLSNKKIETATVTLNTDDHHLGYTNADGIILDNCMSNGNRLREDVNDTVSELNGTGRISPAKTIVSRKSPVARPRSKTPTPAPKVVQVNGSREHSPTITTSSSILVNGNKPINDNTNVVEISTTKTMNEFIKNNIYYQDMQNNGTNNINNNNNKKTISKNTATTKVNGNNNSYTNLLSKNQNTSDVQVVNSPSILSSTTVPMKKPDLLQIQMKRINQNNELEMANNRKNLINDSGHKLNTNYDKTRSCDNELKEKLFSEMFINSLNRGDNGGVGGVRSGGGGSGGRVNEANNNYVKYSDIQNKFMKRSTSCDFLNERPDHDEMLHGTINGNLKCKTMDDKLSEKKVAFHEMLISELTEMRKDGKKLNRDESKSIGSLNTRPNYTKSSPDISPNGTRRSRIRNSDVIEVDDTGKQILYSSCFISLEDSGLEDEEKLDDCSSGVGDSWDSCKEVEDR